MDDLICIGTTRNMIRETPKAVLFRIGTSNSGQSIERFIPKSQMYEKRGDVYVPKWLARSMGMWNCCCDDAYRQSGYIKMYDNADDDLPF